MARQKKFNLFDEAKLNKVLDVKKNKVMIGYDPESEVVMISNSFFIIRAPYNTFDIFLKADGKIMGYVARAMLMLGGEKGIVLFDKYNPHGCISEGTMTYDVMGNVFNVKKPTESYFTGFKKRVNEHDLDAVYLIQHKLDGGKYDYGAFDEKYVDVIPEERALINGKYYGKLGPLYYRDENSQLDYLVLPIRFNASDLGLEKFLKTKDGE